MNFLKFVAVGLTVVMASTGAKAVVIDFESGFDPFFSYNGVAISTQNTNGGFGNVKTFTGSTRVALNPFEVSPSSFNLNGPGTFDLNSFVIAGAWGSQTLSIEGLLSNTQRFSTALAVTMSAQFVSLNWSGIDELRISIDPNGYIDAADDGGAGQHWVLDNLTVDESNAVPEPGILAIFGLGLAGLSYSQRKRRVRQEPQADPLKVAHSCPLFTQERTSLRPGQTVCL